MTKQEFWRLLDHCRSSDTDVYFGALEEETAKLSPEERRSFRGYLASYLNAAAECVWLDMACKVINGYVSDDTALYFTLWVIAQGEQALLDALKDPDSLADLPYIPFGCAEFEMLMGVGFDEDAYEEVAGGNCDTPEGLASREAGIAVPPQMAEELSTEIIYKNGDRYGGFERFESAMEAIPKTLPRLMRRAEQQGFNWKN